MWERVLVGVFICMIFTLNMAGIWTMARDPDDRHRSIVILGNAILAAFCVAVAAALHHGGFW